MTNSLTTITHVLAKPYYLLLAGFVAFVVFSYAMWVPNIALIATYLSLPNVVFMEKLTLLVGLYASITTSFTLFTATYTIAMSLLFGINMALLVYYIRKVRRGQTQGVRYTGLASLGGIIAGFFGIGCAACGTVILSAFLSLIGATTLLSYLPFGGEEFGVLGVALLIYATYMLSKKIMQGSTCPIDAK